MIRSPVTRWVAVATILVVAGCSSSNACEPSPSCWPYGTYVDANDELGAVQARICYDDDCRTIAAHDGDNDIFDGFNTDVWQDGRQVHLTIDVLDASGTSIASISEDRVMDSGGCACGVLYYGWRDDQLYRMN